MSTEKADFWDYIHLAVLWRKKIILNCFLVGIIAAAISLTLPKVYVAHTTVLPSGSDNDMMGLSSLIGDLPIPIGGLGGLSSLSGESATYIAILNSRSVMDSATVRFNLQKRYKKRHGKKLAKCYQKESP